MASWLGLHWLDWLVLLIYLFGVTAIGIWAMRKVKDVTDFFMGGRRFGKVFMMFFAFGAGTHSEQAVSVVAGTWRAGLAGIWWQFLWLWATPFYWIIAPIMRRMRALTTSDYFQARFGTSSATLYCIFGMIMAIVTIGGGLYGSGKMINALTGGALEQKAEELDLKIVPQVKIKPRFSFEIRALQGHEIAILAMTVLFVTYGMAGGLGAAIITDFIQGILTIIFSFLLLPWLMWKVGWSLHSQGELKEGMFDLFGRAEVAQILGKEPITIFYVVMLSLAALIGIVAQPHIMGVCGAGKTEFEGRFGFTVGNFIKRFCTIAWTFMGLACIVWYLGANSPLKNSDNEKDRTTYQQLKQVAQGDFEGLSEEKKEELDKFDKNFADGLFGRAAYELLPPGLVGLLLASLLAAIMSTCDAQMVVASGLFTENIYKRFIRTGQSQRHYLWVGRFAALGIVFLALLLQTAFTDVIHALGVIIKTPAAIGISLWFGLVWRRWTTAAVWVSSISAYSAWAFAAHAPQWFVQLESLNFMINQHNEQVKQSWVIFMYLGTGIVTGLIVSLLTRPEPKDKLDKFYRLIRTPVTEGEVIKAPCTLPENPAEPIEKWFKHPNIEIPKPTKLDVIGFVGSWVCVGLIIALVVWLAS